jgi:hypothetical protein
MGGLLIAALSAAADLRVKIHRTHTHHNFTNSGKKETRESNESAHNQQALIY